MSPYVVFGRSAGAQRVVEKAQPPGVDRNTASVARVISDALLVLAASADNKRAVQGARIRQAPMIVDSLDWAGFAVNLQPIAKYLGASIKAYAKAEIPVGVKQKAVTIGANTDVFDAIDELSIAYAQKRTGQLIAEINDSTRASVQTLVTSSLQGNLTVDQLGRRLRDDIPLSSSATAAVDKYHDQQFTRLIKEGKTIDEAGRTASMLSDKYAAKKLRQRTTTIARTELSYASNQGRYAGWEAGVGAGHFSPDSIKEWQAAGGACDQCRELDGLLAPWDGEFPNGLQMPPDHPACRCTAVMLPPDPDLLAQMNHQFDSSDGGSPLDRIQRKPDMALADAPHVEPPTPPGSPAKTVTPKALAEDVAKRAAENEETTTALMQSLSKENGLSMAGLDQRLKTVDSLTRKIKDDAKALGIPDADAADMISDALRFTMISKPGNYVDSIDKVLDGLVAKGWTGREKNAWADDLNPYMGTNVALVDPAGQKVELQFHTQESFDLKNGLMHDLYRQYQLSSDPLERQRLLAEMWRLSGDLDVPPGVLSRPKVRTVSP